MEPLPSTSTATNYKSKPLSLEMFNCTATDLNEKGAINLKKYKKYLTNHLTKKNGSGNAVWPPQSSK